MTFPQETELKPVTLTQSAANAVRDVVSKRNLQGYALRLRISGGGCCGYQYALLLDNSTQVDDTVTETDGIKLLVDQVSINFLHGATVDYIDGLTSSGFKITNPNVQDTCGCGQSFNSTASEGEVSSSECQDCA